MCQINVEELLDRLEDRFTVAELVDMLDITYDDLKTIGILEFLEENLDRLTDVLEEAGVVFGAEDD